MRDLIKKILNESVGVPSGILESSEELYKLILEEIKSFDDEIEGYYGFELNTEFKISDLKINKVIVDLTFEMVDDIKEVEYYSMAILQNAAFDNKIMKLKTIIVPGVIRLSINMAGPKNTTMKDIIDYFTNKRNLLISTLSHELGHAYNNYKQNLVPIKGIGSYMGITKTSFPFRPIQTFLFYMYYTHTIENLVRPIEISSLMRTGDIDREGFYDFITNNETYQMLKKIGQFSYEKMREDLKKHSDSIRKFLRYHPNIKNLNTDDQLVDELLRVVYINLVNNTTEQINNIMTTGEQESLLGFVGKKEEKFLDLVDFFSKFENNIEGFYKYEEKNMKRVSEKMLKRLSKLWSLVKSNPSSIRNWELHQKINKHGEKIETELKYKR